MMAPSYGDERPPWWQFYAIALLLPALLGLVELLSGPAALLAALRLASVAVVFGLLGLWIHGHRGLAPRSRDDAPETADEALDLLAEAEHALDGSASARRRHLARHAPPDRPYADPRSHLPMDFS